MFLDRPFGWQGLLDAIIASLVKVFSRTKFFIRGGVGQLPGQRRLYSPSRSPSLTREAPLSGGTWPGAEREALCLDGMSIGFSQPNTVGP
jgi:hypothetical protein